MPVKSAVVSVVAVLLLAAACTAGAQEIVSLPTRDGVKQEFLLTAPDGGKPAAAALLFPGGAGSIRLRNEGGRIRFGEGNFLVRSRQLFVERGVAAAVMDAPSDHAQGMDDHFRLGDNHVIDVTAVVAELQKRYPGTPVFLIGTSRGSISVASLGRTLGNKVAGAVLTSTLFHGGSRFGPALDGFDFSKIGMPVLVVHHINDGCRESPYRDARQMSETQRYPMISVSGGNPPTSAPCEAFTPHGYLGREAQTVDAIVNWMLKKPYPANIE
jgi:hypothetical protein